jgi:ATP-dependent RNA helicase SUPV3L1/SUV3
MTSLTGSAGEDFASILRALGYRMERRAPLPPKPAQAVEATPEAAPETVVDESGWPAEITMADIVDQQVSGDPAPSAALTPVASEEAPAAVEAAPVAEAAPEPVVEVAPELAPVEAALVETTPVEPAVAEAPTEATSEIATETAASEAIQAEAAAGTEATSETPAEPVLIEVWRPGGRSEERRPRPDRNRHRHQNRPQTPLEGVPQEGAAAATGEAAADGARRERHGRGRRERNKDFHKPRTDAPVEANAAAATPAEGAPACEPRPDNRGNRDDKSGRPPRGFASKGKEGGRDNRDKGKFGGGRDKGGRDKGDRDGRSDGPSHRQYASSAPPRERERPIDPNSPFAKLAALREQLTANKDR